MRSIKLCALILAVVSPHFIQANPGTYEFIPGWSPIFRPTGGVWTDWNSSSQHATLLFENRRVIFALPPVSERVGGYHARQLSVNPGPSLPNTSFNANSLPLDLRLFAGYIPAGSETPTGVNAKFLTAIGGFVAVDAVDWFGPGSGQVNFNNRSELFLWADAGGGGYKATENYFTTVDQGVISAVGMVHDQTLIVGGSHSLDAALGWVFRATHYTLEVQSSITLNVGDNGSAGGYLDVYRAAKLTWVDDQQLDSGWIREDIDGDGEVGPSDASRLSLAWGSFDGDPRYDKFADINQDGEVGPADFGLLSQWFGQTVTFFLPYPVRVDTLGHW